MRKIAIVEDAKDNRDLLYYLLRDEFKVTRYSNGEEALRDFAQNRPDLIILDIWLPGIDGTEVLKRCKNDGNLCNVPILALTAHAMMGDREKFLGAGFDAYAAKPIVDIDQFIHLLRQLLNGSHD